MSEADKILLKRFPSNKADQILTKRFGGDPTKRTDFPTLPEPPKSDYLPDPTVSPFRADVVPPIKPLPPTPGAETASPYYIHPDSTPEEYEGEIAKIKRLEEVQKQQQLKFAGVALGGAQKLLKAPFEFISGVAAGPPKEFGLEGAGIAKRTVGAVEHGLRQIDPRRVPKGERFVKADMAKTLEKTYPNVPWYIKGLITSFLEVTTDPILADIPRYAIEKTLVNSFTKNFGGLQRTLVRPLKFTTADKKLIAELTPKVGGKQMATEIVLDRMVARSMGLKGGYAELSALRRKPGFFRAGGNVEELYPGVESLRNLTKLEKSAQTFGTAEEFLQAQNAIHIQRMKAGTDKMLTMKGNKLYDQFLRDFYKQAGKAKPGVTPVAERALGEISPESAFTREFKEVARGDVFPLAGTIKDVGGKGIPKKIPKELEPLAKEARKYKTAEEFVKSKGVLDTEKELLRNIKSTKQEILNLEKGVGFGGFKISKKGKQGQFVRDRIKTEKSLLKLSEDKLQKINDLTQTFNQAKGIGKPPILPKVLPTPMPFPVAPRTTKAQIREAITPSPEKITKTTGQLLRDRVRSEVRGSKLGYKAGAKDTRTLITEKYREEKIGVEQVRKEVSAYIKQELPISEQGKFLQAVSKKITKKRAVSIMGRVVDSKEKLLRKEATGDIKKLRYPKTTIAVDYQKTIVDLTRDIDFARMTTATRKSLTGLQEYLKRNQEALNLHPELLQKVSRLSKMPIRDMTTKEMTDLRDTIQHLNKLGKLKQELKMKYNKRELDVAATKLAKSSVNMDVKMKYDAQGKPSDFSRYKEEVKKIYMNTLHTPRVANMADGRPQVTFSGENAKIIKKFNRKENEYNKASRDLTTESIEKIAAVKNDWTQPEMNALMFHIRKEEGAFDAANAILVKAGLKAEPQLTDEMRKTIDITREIVGERNVGDIATIFEEMENIPFEKLENYTLPLKYEKELNVSSVDLIHPHRNRTAKTFKGFTFERTEGVKKVPRTDFFNLLEEAIRDQQWYLKMQPLLENTRYLVSHPKYREAVGDMMIDFFWKDYMDIVSRRGWSANAKGSWILKKGRINLSVGVLGYKMSSFLMQPFAAFDAMAYGQMQWGPRATAEIFAEFGLTWLTPGKAKKIVAESLALQARRGGEVAIEEILVEVSKKHGIYNKLKKGALAPLMWADLKTAAGAQRAFEKILTRHGVADAHEEAEFLMNMVSGSSEITMRPLILGRGEGARLWFTFQTFFLNRWGLIAEDLVMGGLVKGKLKKKINALIGLGILMAAAIAEEEARSNVNALIKGKKYKDQSILSMVIMALPKQIPYFGNIIESAVRGFGGSQPPLIRTVENIVGGSVKAFTAKTEEKRIREALKATEGVMAALVGFPGTAQLFDLIERGLIPPEDEKAKSQADKILERRFKKKRSKTKADTLLERRFGGRD